MYPNQQPSNAPRPIGFESMSYSGGQPPYPQQGGGYPPAGYPAQQPAGYPAYPVQPGVFIEQMDDPHGLLGQYRDARSKCVLERPGQTSLADRSRHPRPPTGRPTEQSRHYCRQDFRLIQLILQRRRSSASPPRSFSAPSYQCTRLPPS
uniref:Uncharacterized protein n=1 Tax=Plectus sambesii TaxID=2011161 RepID=A0A914WFC0_9BILA